MNPQGRMLAAPFVYNDWNIFVNIEGQGAASMRPCA